MDPEVTFATTGDEAYATEEVLAVSITSRKATATVVVVTGQFSPLPQIQ